MFGLSKPIDICYIKGCACRPIVTCTPNAVHFGQVKVLGRSQRTITVNNDSPVRVLFRACMVGNYEILHTLQRALRLRTRGAVYTRQRHDCGTAAFVELVTSIQICMQNLIAHFTVPFYACNGDSYRPLSLCMRVLAKMRLDVWAPTWKSETFLPPSNDGRNGE